MHVTIFALFCIITLMGNQSIKKIDIWFNNKTLEFYLFIQL